METISDANRSEAAPARGHVQGQAVIRAERRKYNKRSSSRATHTGSADWTPAANYALDINPP